MNLFISNLYLKNILIYSSYFNNHLKLIQNSKFNNFFFNLLNFNFFSNIKLKNSIFKQFLSTPIEFKNIIYNKTLIYNVPNFIEISHCLFYKIKTDLNIASAIHIDNFNSNISLSFSSFFLCKSLNQNGIIFFKSNNLLFNKNCFRFCNSLKNTNLINSYSNSGLVSHILISNEEIINNNLFKFNSNELFINNINLSNLITSSNIFYQINTTNLINNYSTLKNCSLSILMILSYNMQNQL